MYRLLQRCKKLYYFLGFDIDYKNFDQKNCVCIGPLRDTKTSKSSKNISRTGTGFFLWHICEKFHPYWKLLLVHQRVVILGVITMICNRFSLNQFEVFKLYLFHAMTQVAYFIHDRLYRLMIHMSLPVIISKESQIEIGALNVS